MMDERVAFLRRALVHIRDDEKLSKFEVRYLAAQFLKADEQEHMHPKQGKDYIEFLEKTAAEVDTWPDWKKGK